jgi:hypothetical protein
VIQMNPFYSYMQPITLIYVWIFYLNLRLGLSNSPSPSEFLSKDLYGFRFCPICDTCSATQLPLIDHPNNIQWREHIISPPYAYSLFSCPLSSFPFIT